MTELELRRLVNESSGPAALQRLGAIAACVSWPPAKARKVSAPRIAEASPRAAAPSGPRKLGSAEAAGANPATSGARSLQPTPPTTKRPRPQQLTLEDLL